MGGQRRLASHAGVGVSCLPLRGSTRCALKPIQQGWGGVKRRELGGEEAWHERGRSLI